MNSISEEKAAEAANSFRSSLEDLITIADGLKKHCVTVEDLISVSRLALDSDGQLKILMDLVAVQNNKR